jgi:phenylpyruvate tautomerase PptA (4-oxalocrotonate tautomerase family)
MGENMPYIDIKIAWNWGTAAQRARIIEKAAKIVVDVLKKEPLVKSIIIKGIDHGGSEMSQNESSACPPS